MHRIQSVRGLNRVSHITSKLIGWFALTTSRVRAVSGVQKDVQLVGIYTRPKCTFGFSFVVVHRHTQSRCGVYTCANGTLTYGVSRDLLLLIRVFWNPWCASANIFVRVHLTGVIKTVEIACARELNYGRTENYLSHLKSALNKGSTRLNVSHRPNLLSCRFTPQETFSQYLLIKTISILIILL